MNKKWISSMALAVYFLLFLASPVLAGGFTVFGATIETSVSPGNDYSYTIKVENTSDAPMDIGVEVKGYGISANRDFIALESEEDKSPYTARELLAVSPDNFHLEPGDSQVITVTAEIPPEIGDGGRYAIVFIHTVPKGEVVATISAIAARVLLTIADSNLVTNSEITEVSLAASGGPVGVLVTVENKGNYHYKPQIQAQLSNGNKVVATASLSPDWPIIPGYSRQFELDFVGEESLSAGEYAVDIEVKDDSGKLVADGTYPLKFAKEQEMLPPEEPPQPSQEDSSLPTTSEKPSLPSGEETPAEMNWTLIGGIIGGVIIVVLLVVIGLLLKRRRAY